jgi:hypothetical protein
MSEEVATIPKGILSYAVLTTEAGQEVMDNLKKSFGFDSPAFIPSADGSYDPLKAAIRDGQRQVILHIEACIHRAIHETPKKKTARKD